MYKLILLVHFFIFFINYQSPHSVQAKPHGEITLKVLLNRSYQPKLIHSILSRSMAQSKPKLKSSPPRQPHSGIVNFHSRSSLKPRLYPIYNSGLNIRVLNQLNQFDSHILRYSHMYGIEPNLTRAIIYVESAADAGAISPTGAIGLMQLMPKTATDMGVSNPLDPIQNIFGGTRYIGSLINQFKSLDLALWAYNAGPESVKQKRLPRETKQYIPKVLRIKSILDQGGA